MVGNGDESHDGADNVGHSPDMPKVILLCEGILVRLAEIKLSGRWITVMARTIHRLLQTVMSYELGVMNGGKVVFNAFMMAWLVASYRKGKIWMRSVLEEAVSGHFLWHWEAHQLENGGGEVAKFAVIYVIEIFVYEYAGDGVGGVGGIGRTVGIDYEIGVSMVGSDEETIAIGDAGMDYLGDTAVNRLGGFDNGREHACMAYHIGVCEV